MKSVHHRSSTQTFIMSNSTSMNHDGRALCPFAVSVFFTTIMALISSAAFIGNILVIVTVYKTPNLRTSTNYYYVNMAVSDFLACLTTWPLYLTDEIITTRGSLLQGALATFGCKVGVFFRLLSFIVSILSLVLIAVDRFIATAFPLKATLITHNTRATLLFSTWLISTGYCFLAFHYSRVEEVGHQIFCRFSWNDLAIMIYYTTGMILFTVIPLITIIALYSRINRILRRRLQPVAETDTRCSNFLQNRSRQNRSIMKIFQSIVVAYFISFFFVGVYLTLKMTSPKIFNKDGCKLILGFGYYVLPSVSTAVNPMILFTFSTNFRQALRMTNLCVYSFTKCFSHRKVTGISPPQS